MQIADGVIAVDETIFISSSQRNWIVVFCDKSRFRLERLGIAKSTFLLAVRRQKAAEQRVCR